MFAISVIFDEIMYIKHKVLLLKMPMTKYLKFLTMPNNLYMIIRR